jgi:hypothetical protein
MMATTGPIRFPVHALLIVLLAPLCVCGGSSSHADERSRIAEGTITSATVLADVPSSDQPIAWQVEDLDGDAPSPRSALPLVAGAWVVLPQWRTQRPHGYPVGTGSARGPPHLFNRA